MVIIIAGLKQSCTRALEGVKQQEELQLLLWHSVTASNGCIAIRGGWASACSQVLANQATPA